MELINTKEKIISNLEKIIKKIDNEQYSGDKKNYTQLIRSDLIYIFQIILNSNNVNKEENGKLNLKINVNEINYNYSDNLEDQIAKTETNIGNKPNKKISSELLLKDTKNIFKKNSLEDFFTYERNPVKNSNINRTINIKKVSKDSLQKNNNKGIHDYKNSAGGSFYYKTNNNGSKIESKISKKNNPFEQPLINKENKKNKK